MSISQEQGLGKWWGSGEVWTGENGTEGEAEGSKPFPPEQLDFYLFYIMDFHSRFCLEKNRLKFTTKFEKQKLIANVYAQRRVL